MGVILAAVGFCAPIIMPQHGLAWMIMIITIAIADISLRKNCAN